MKEVYVLRHAEKDASGELTKQGKHRARTLGESLPNFAIVVTSKSPRTIETAELLSSQKPITDDRAGYYATTQEVSADIARLATERSINFFEAADMYNGGMLRDGIHAQAVGLNRLIDETLARLSEDEQALVVSHDMTIVPAMVLRGQSRISVNYLSGYVIGEGGVVSAFKAE